QLLLSRIELRQTGAQLRAAVLELRELLRPLRLGLEGIDDSGDIRQCRRTGGELADRRLLLVTERGTVLALQHDLSGRAREVRQLALEILDDLARGQPRDVDRVGEALEADEECDGRERDGDDPA